jgi:hypothetical protein
MLTTSWTDYNESDPGITLLEMLVWIVEKLAYQADVIPIDGYRSMLRWVLGLAHSGDNDKGIEYLQTASQYDLPFVQLRSVLAQIEAGAALDVNALRQAVLGFRMRQYLALTLEDVQQVALETNAQINALGTNALLVKQAYTSAIGGVTQLFVLSNLVWLFKPSTVGNANLALGKRAIYYAGDATAWDQNNPPQTISQAQEGKLISALLTSVRTHLAPRTLLGNQIAVRRVELTPVSIHCTASCLPREDADRLAQAVMTCLLNYLQPNAIAPYPAWNYGDAPDEDALLSRVSTITGIESVSELKVVLNEALMLGNAWLGCNTWLGIDSSIGGVAQVFRGLPQPRYIEVTVTEVGAV